MAKKSLFKITACAMAIVMLFIVITVIGSSGKTKIKYSAEVKIVNGAITVEKGENRQAIYLPTKAEKCTFDVSFSGAEGIESTVGVYKDPAGTDSYFTLTGVKDNQSKEVSNITDGAVYLVIQQSLATGAALPDGSYYVEYKVKMTDDGTAGSKFLAFLVGAAILGIFVWVMHLENEKTQTASKKQLRMRGRAYAGAFFTLVMMVLGFGLLGAIAPKFPFTLFQAALISVLVAATVFVILAYRLDAFSGVQEKKKLLTMVFFVVGFLNFIAGMINVFGKSAEIAPVGTGMIRDGFVNLVAGVCFVILAVNFIVAKKTGRSTRSRAGRSSSSRGGYSRSYSSKSYSRSSSQRSSYQGNSYQGNSYDDGYSDDSYSDSYSDDYSYSGSKDDYYDEVDE